MGKKLHPLRVEEDVFVRLKEVSKANGEPLNVLVTRLLGSALSPPLETSTPLAADVTSMVVKRSTKERAESFAFAADMTPDDALEHLSSYGIRRLDALAKAKVTGKNDEYKKRKKLEREMMAEVARRAG